MAVKLPQEYIENMRKVLGDELGTFLMEYDKPALKALRFNTMKVRTETIDKLISEWRLEQVPWCRDGYYYEESKDLRPGLSPYHDAGVFYIQEPSAMLTAERAGIDENDIVLDLCAAPGGKSTQAAAKCRLLVSNEPVPQRARILSSNIERMGFGNVIVSSAYPDQLAAVFRNFFTKIIVDAPCSGEGMMRKDETAVREWSLGNVELCISRQKEILDAAAGMLKPGGRLIYSTCTFEPGENECQITDFLSRHPEYSLISEETIYPHRAKGEGHFCAVLFKAAEEAGQCAESGTYTGTGADNESYADTGSGADTKSAVRHDICRAGNTESAVRPDLYSLRNPKKNRKALKQSGAADSKADVNAAKNADIRDELLFIQKHMQKNGIHILRCGIQPGEYIADKKGNKRYEPSHAEALAGALSMSFIDLKLLPAAMDYLKGNVIDLSALPRDSYELHSDGGWLTVRYDGYPLGLGKLVGGTVKNHYPKGLRHV